MASWVERKWDRAAKFALRHPKKSMAITLMGAWYQAVDDFFSSVAALLPSRTAIAEAWPDVSWPDWSVTWVTGPLVTGLLLLMWWQSRHGRGPFASGGAWERDYANRLADDLEEAAKIKHFPEAVRALDEARAETRRVEAERDSARAEVAAIKTEFGRTRLRWFADRTKRNIEIGRKAGETITDIRATVRFAVYTDLDLVNSIAKILREDTDWKVELDGSNKPTLMPDPKGYKVIVDVGPMRTFNEVAVAFNSGELLGPGVKVGARISDRFNEMEHLVIDVLPVVTP